MCNECALPRQPMDRAPMIDRKIFFASFSGTRPSGFSRMKSASSPPPANLPPPPSKLVWRTGDGRVVGRVGTHSIMMYMWFVLSMQSYILMIDGWLRFLRTRISLR